MQNQHLKDVHVYIHAHVYICMSHEGRRKTPERQGKIILRGREEGVMGVVWLEQREDDVREKDHKRTGNEGQ